MQTSQVYQFGPFQLLPSDRLLLHEEQVVRLPPKVFDTLVILVQNSGHVVEKDHLMQVIWPDAFVEDGSLTRNISILRKTLNPEDAHSYIDTVPKIGYRFVAEVRELGLEGAATAIEKFRVSRISTLEEETLSLKDYDLSARLRQLPGKRWSVRVGIAATGAAILISSWVLWFGRAEVARSTAALATFSQVSDQPGEELFPSLSPDGQLIVYASNRSGNWDIYLQRVGGKTPINLTPDSPVEDTQPAFSPDGKHIAFRSWREGGGVFVMGATGENVRRIADFGYNPGWSHDGKEIVCAMDGVEEPSNRSIIPSRLWAVNVSTGQKRLISEGDSVHPQWSPHGHRIAYWGLQKGGKRDIWTVSANGSSHEPVTNDEHFNWNPVWSPDGKYLYFISDRSGSMNLWRLPIEEQSGKVLGQPEPVTTPSSYTQHVTFSRNRKHLAYVRVANRQNIKRVAFDPGKETVEGEPTWITEGDKHTTSPDLSPDGQWITFHSQGERQEDIFVTKNDGSSLRKLTDDSYRDRGPRWSPDGERLAFYSDRSGKYEIWTVNFDGTQLKQITNTASPLVFYPVWSPDGAHLAYRTRGNPASIIEVGKAWDQQSPEMLPHISDDARLRFTPWSWSSDGLKLAGWLYAPENPHSGIVVFSLDSRTFEKLSDFGNRPSWLSDNQRMVFFYQEKLYLLDRRSGKIKELMSTGSDKIEGLSISKDDRMICFSFEIVEADIWLATLQ